ncbi:MAG: cyanophycin synthetase, partial [Fimbriimonadaceae bacterium]
DDIGEWGGRVRPVPGRFEPVPNEAGIGILVDYAHTPDALEKLLDAVRPLTAGRVITVFGCGGDRDRTKRPKMARAASERSDLVVVTSDNPRTEDPEQILDDIVAGLASGVASVRIADRREAVAHAVRVAQPGDVVVIAGKGHEKYQIVGQTKHPMDDRELAREGLSLR